MGTVVNALRVATTGQAVGPGLYDCLAILGRESCRRRIAAAIAMLEARGLDESRPTAQSTQS
jgi:glutamyl/glutaminyl-tRNA synthetase